MAQIFNKMVTVALKPALSRLLGAGIQGALGNYGGAAANLLGVLDSITLADGPDTLLPRLILRSHVRAMAGLLDASGFNWGGVDREAAAAALETVSLEALAGDDPALAVMELETPHRLPFVATLADKAAAWAASIGFGPPDAPAVGPRYPAYFAEALHSELLGDFERYKSLLDLANVPTASAALGWRQWRRYHAGLIKACEVPIFESPATLNQIYIPPRGRRVFRDPAETGEDRTERRRWEFVPAVEDDLINWIRRTDKKSDYLRLISGGPGSGKSSLAKRLAARLAGTDDQRVLLIPLGQFSMTGTQSFEGTLAGYLRRCAISLPETLLTERDRPLVLLLDGLDEFTLGGNAGGGNAVRYLIEQLINHLRDATIHGCPICAVALGRPAAMAGLDQTYPHALIELLPLAIPPDSELRRADWKTDVIGSIEDQRDRFWRGFWQAIGDTTRTGLPDELGGPDHADLTAEPILNMLLALRYWRQPTFAAPSNRAALYYDLIDDVYTRRWGAPEAGHPVGKELLCDAFWAILGKIGVALWHARDRQTDLETLTRYIDRRATGERPANLKTVYKNFETGIEHGKADLLAAFYFRWNEPGNRANRFEFTHKSFGEYFAVRALFDEIERLHRRLTGDEPELLDQELLIWTALAGPSGLTDMINFLQGESDRRYSARTDDLEKLIDTVETCWHWMLEHGTPVHKLLPEQRLAADSQYKNFTALDAQARNAAQALVTIGAALALTNLQASNWESARRFRFCPANADEALRDRVGQVFADWHQGGRRVGWRQYLPAVDLGDAKLERAKLGYANLRVANLRVANLLGASLEYANLGYANLEHANLGAANLGYASLERADLGGANLGYANLGYANLEHANLGYANLERADLGGANLGYAKLEGANLAGANFTSATIDPKTRARYNIPDGIYPDYPNEE